MASLLAKMISFYNYIFVDMADPRTAKYPLMGNPFPTLALMAAYVWFVQKKGPQMMAKRQPFDLKNVLIGFNALQVLANFYLLYMCVDLGWGRHYNWRCQPVETPEGKNAQEIARGVYMFFLLKVSDLLDTVFFVLRKRQRQVTFLHVYHHTGMVALAWAGSNFFPGGHGTFVGLLNTFVHVVMYSYYLLTALNAEYKNSIWWKRHLTQLQMVQFLFIGLHMAQLLWEDCGYPRWVASVLLPQNAFMFLLFADFYRKAYIKPGKDK